MVKVAINGFGRIGRLAFRLISSSRLMKVVAINDLTSPDMLAYLLKYDSTQGRFDKNIKAGPDFIKVGTKKYPVYAEPDASKLPWKKLGIDVVLECTGFYTSKEKAEAHIKAGARRVLISAPAGNDVPTVVYNVNHKSLSKSDRIVSGASCTTNCLAPMTKALNDFAPIQAGFMSTVHAYTGDQMILDGPHRKGDKRRARAGAVNIVPNSTGAAKAIGLVIPELKGKLTGNALRIPTPTGSITVLDAVVESKKELDINKINAAVKKASNESFGYEEDPIVSSDIVGMSYGSLFDPSQTDCMKIRDGLYQVRVTSWYDNEMSYTNQLIRTLKYMASLK